MASLEHIFYRPLEVYAPVDETNGAFISQTGAEHPIPVDGDSRYLDTKGIDWEQDLAPAGKWLFRELLIGAEDIELLEQYAKADGIDLNAAIQVLDGYELIDKSDPGFFHLPWQKISPK